jgi:hypothetical protein
VIEGGIVTEGRAIILGETTSRRGECRKIQYQGSGQPPGRATVTATQRRANNKHVRAKPQSAPIWASEDTQTLRVN